MTRHVCRRTKRVADRTVRVDRVVSEFTSVTVARANPQVTGPDEFSAPTGNEGSYWAAHADDFDRGIAAYHRPFLEAAGIRDGDRVLDIGCGTGQTTRDAARAAKSGSVLGVDLSSQMLEYARRRAVEERVGNIVFEQADAQVHPFEAGTFDVAISRTGAMFFGDPVAAFANISRALRPGGRLALLTWQGPGPNVWIRELSGALAAGRDLPLPPPEAPGPFALSDPERVRAILTAAGYTDIRLDGRSEPMWFGDNAERASGFVLGLMGWMLEELDDARRAQALDNLRISLSAHETGRGVLYESATWTIHAIRREPQ
jgi:SAM-dependent methyltransferase